LFINYPYLARHITIKYTENSKNCDLDTFNDERQLFKIVKIVARKYGIYYIYPDFTINIPEINEDQPVDHYSMKHDKITYPLMEYTQNTYTLNEAIIKCSTIINDFLKL
jgi:hypothetical protein